VKHKPKYVANILEHNNIVYASIKLI